MTRTTDAACAAMLGSVMAVGSAPVLAADGDAVGGHVFVTDALLSPAGKSLALVENAGGERFVSVLALDGGVPVSRVSLGREALVGLLWVDEERLVLTMPVTLRSPGGSRTIDGRYKASVLDTARGRLVPLEPVARQVAVVDFLTALPALRPSGDRVRAYLQTQVVSHRTRAALASVDPVSGAGRIESTTRDALAEWLVDVDGKPAAVLEHSATDGRWILRVAGAAGMEERLSGDARDGVPQLAGFGPDGDSLLLRVRDDGRAAWRLLSRADGSLSDAAGAGPYGQPLLERLTGRVFGYCHPAERRCSFVLPRLQQRWDAVQRAFGDASVELVSFSDDLRKFVVLVEDPAGDPQYHLVDFETGQADVIGAGSPSREAATLSLSTVAQRGPAREPL